MGTRSLTHIKDGNDRTLITFYRQMDGYPTGHGQELADFLKPFALVNGIGLNESRQIANGMGCLAAQVLAYFKNDQGVGGIYVQIPDASDCGEEYTYTIRPAEGINPYNPPSSGAFLRLTCQKVYGEGGVLYDGPPEDFDGAEIEKQY